MEPRRGTGGGVRGKGHRALVGGVVSAALLTAVFLVPRGEDPEPSVSSLEGVPQVSLSPAAPVAPDAFCSAFRQLADAHSHYLAKSTESMAVRLLDQATAVVELGVPVGMSAAGYAAFADLVIGVLSPLSGSDEVRARVRSAARGESPDQDELDRYLGDACPA